MSLSFFEVHSFDAYKGAFITILELVLLVSEELNCAFLFITDASDDRILKFFSVLVKYFEVVTKVIEHSAKDSRKLREDEFLSLRATVVIDCDGCGVVSFGQDYNIHVLEVPRFSL